MAAAHAGGGRPDVRGGGAQATARSGGRGGVATYRDAAIVLRKLDYGEADRIFTLLTREHGKVGAIAKGVRRSGSKLAAPLEVFGQLDVLLAHGRSLDVVTEAHRLPGPRLAADIERTSRAAIIVELAERICEERAPVEGLYELTAYALEQLALEDDPRRAIAWFLSVALDFMGYSPQLAACARCGRELEPVAAEFSAQAGGLLCPSCSSPGAPLVSVNAIKVLRVMAGQDLALYRRLKLDAGIMGEIEDALAAQLEWHLDRQLKSLRFLRRMAASP